MRRNVILAGLALALLVAGVLALMPGASESAPGDVFPSSTSVSSSAKRPAATFSGARSASTALAPSGTGTAAAPARMEPGRKAQSARAAMLAAKRQQLPRVTPGSAPAARSGPERLPPEEVAAMEARGMDWRKLEQMMRGGIPGEAAAPVTEEPPAPGEAQDEESR